MLLLVCSASVQDVKALLSVPLLGCIIEASPQALQGQHSFCLKQSKSTHMFCCDGPELKHSWLAVLKAAVAAGYGHR